MQRKGGYQRKTEQQSYGGTFARQDSGNYTIPQYKRESPAYKAAAAKAQYLELNKGDMVQHTAFGRGLVLSVMKMGGDALLEIAFDEIGTKKLMAKTASAHMKRL